MSITVWHRRRKNVNGKRKTYEKNGRRCRHNSAKAQNTTDWAENITIRHAIQRQYLHTYIPNAFVCALLGRRCMLTLSAIFGSIRGVFFLLWLNCVGTFIYLPYLVSRVLYISRRQGQTVINFHKLSRSAFWYTLSQGCGVDRVFIGVDSDSGVGVLVSTPTPTPGPTRACLEWIALCNVQFLCIGHSYARHLIVGQVKLQAGPKRDDPTWTRPGPDRVGWLLPPYHNWTLFAIALDQMKTIFEPPLSRASRAGVLYMTSVTVQIVLSSVQTRLQKGLIPRPEQNDTFQISEPGWVWVRNFDRLPSLLYRTAQGLVRYLSSSQSTTKICAKMA